MTVSFQTLRNTITVRIFIFRTLFCKTKLNLYFCFILKLKIITHRKAQSACVRIRTTSAVIPHAAAGGMKCKTRSETTDRRMRSGGAYGSGRNPAPGRLQCGEEEVTIRRQDNGQPVIQLFLHGTILHPDEKHTNK